MKSLIHNLTKYILPVLFFAIIIFCISYKPLLNKSPIAYNDGSYYFNSLEKNSYIKNSYSDDYFGSNLSSTIFLRKIKWETNLVLKKTWLPDYIVSYVMSFWLLFFASLMYFYIFSRISKNILYWYFAWIFVIFNNFTIESIAFWWFFYYGLWLIALWGLCWMFHKIHNSNQVTLMNIWWIVLLWSFIILPIHLVIYYIVVFSFFVYLFFDKTFKGKYLLALSLIILTGVHAYWIVPFIVNTLVVSSGEVYAWNASWVLTWYSKIANYINIISFRQYFNTISIQLFSTPIVSIYYILWLLSLIFVLIKSKKWERNTSFIFLLFILYFLFFNISLWPNSAITGLTFQFLWDNVSVFQFFRSFTRFIIILIPLTLLIYAIYIKVNWIKNKYIIWAIIASFFFHYPLLTWDLKWVIPKMKIPQEYNEINNFLNSYDWNKNIISYPNINYETYTWSISSSEKMRQDYYLKEYFINANTIHNRTSLWLNKKSEDFRIIFSNRINEYLAQYLWDNSIDLVLIHKDSINIFNWEIVPYEEFYNYFINNSNVLIDNEYYSLFQIENSNNTISLDNWKINIEKLSSVKYNLNLTLDNEQDILRFYRNFDANWSVFDTNGNKLNIEQRKHNEVFNKWMFEITKLPANSYTQNNNDTYSLNLVLYYTMQDYLELWKKITFIFLIITLIIILIGFFRRKNEK